MKKQFAYLLLFLFCLEACYEDKGNYDYNPVAPIEMSGIGEEYTAISMVGRLQISPKFKDRENYNFAWTMFSNTIVQPKIDTLSTEPDLDYEVTQGADKYTLVLTVEHKESGDRQFFTTQVIVNTKYSVGYYLLKEVDGKTDIDLITPDWELAENILENTSTRLEGTPMSFSVCNDINYIGEDGEREERVKTVWICSDRDVRMLRLENMTPVYDIHTMFYEERPDERPRNLLYMASGSSVGYLSNNGFYQMHLMVESAAHRFGLPLRLSNPEAEESKDCSAAKHVFCGAGYYMFYDELNCRFLLVSNGIMYRFQDTDYLGRPTMSPNNMNSDLIYMGSTKNFGYALMQDKQTQSKCVYKLEKEAYDKGKLFSPLLERKELKPSLKIANASVFGHNARYDYFYCATDNQLHLYDFGQNKETENILPGLDGKITFIQHYYKEKILNQEAIEYFAVATEKGGRYKIYFYEMLAGKPDLSKAPKTIEGEGCVTDVCLIR